jgi:lysozyme family protein
MTDAVSAGAPAMQNAIPAAHDRTFISYVLGTDSEFDKILPDTEVQEGVPWASGPMPSRAYSDDAHDPGGKTGEGIIQREYDLKRRQWGLPTRWVREMSKDEERTIYFTDYWMPYCPKLSAGLSLEFFDLDVNGGGHRAVVTLQRVLGIADDGQWGPATDAAVATLIASGNIPKAIEDFKTQREAFYRSLGTFKFFGKDWIRRSEEIAKQAEQIDRKA